VFLPPLCAALVPKIMDDLPDDDSSMYTRALQANMSQISTPMDVVREPTGNDIYSNALRHNLSLLPFFHLPLPPPLPPSSDDDFAEANAPGFVDDGYDDVIYDDDDEVPPFDDLPDPSDDDEDLIPSIPLGASLSGRIHSTHLHIQQQREENLKVLLPRLHAGRLVALRGRHAGGTLPGLVECSECKSTDHHNLWCCNECSMLQYACPMLCSLCFVLSHVNSPHNCQLWAEGESFFRPPYANETLTFHLRPCCGPCGLVCECLDPSVPMKEVRVLFPSGVFRCNIPAVPLPCSNCRVLVPPLEPAAVGCTPCEATLERGGTWISRSLMSLALTLRGEGSNSINSIARSLYKSWLGEGSFLVKAPVTYPPSSPPNAVSVNWLEKKLSEAMSNEVLLAHPSWMDNSELFALSDQMDSKCGACVTCCSNVHIDGFFKMKRMKRPLSLRSPRLKFFCCLDEARVDSLKQADLTDGNVNILCSDLGGNVTHFRSGGQGVDLQKSYSQTGVMTAVCPHGVPLRVLPMSTKGEKFYLPHSVIDSLENSQYPQHVSFYSYDVACMMRKYLQSRDSPLSALVDSKLVLGHFHSNAHKCKQENVSWGRHGAGLDDGEQGERWNSRMVSIATSMRYMRNERMLELLEHMMLTSTRHTNAVMGEVLHRRAKAASLALSKHNASLAACVEEVETRLSAINFQVTQELITQWVDDYTSPPSVDAADPNAGTDITEKEKAYVQSHIEWASRCGSIGTIQRFEERRQQLDLVVHKSDLQVAELKYVDEAISVHNRLTRAHAEVSILLPR